jgi:hypothetical protein
MLPMPLHIMQHFCGVTCSSGVHTKGLTAIRSTVHLHVAIVNLFDVVLQCSVLTASAQAPLAPPFRH